MIIKTQVARFTLFILAVDAVLNIVILSTPHVSFIIGKSPSEHCNIVVVSFRTLEHWNTAVSLLPHTATLEHCGKSASTVQ